jgi:hypothetical protein
MRSVRSCREYGISAARNRWFAKLRSPSSPCGLISRRRTLAVAAMKSPHPKHGAAGGGRERPKKDENGERPRKPHTTRAAFHWSRDLAPGLLQIPPLYLSWSRDEPSAVGWSRPIPPFFLAFLRHPPLSLTTGLITSILARRLDGTNGPIENCPIDDFTEEKKNLYPDLLQSHTSSAARSLNWAKN